MRISDWSSDVCSSDLFDVPLPLEASSVFEPTASAFDPAAPLLGSAVPAFDSAGLAAEPAGPGRFWSPDAASSVVAALSAGWPALSVAPSDTGMVWAWFALSLDRKSMA